MQAHSVKTYLWITVCIPFLWDDFWRGSSQHAAHAGLDWRVRGAGPPRTLKLKRNGSGSSFFCPPCSYGFPTPSRDKRGLQGHIQDDHGERLSRRILHVAQRLTARCDDCVAFCCVCISQELAVFEKMSDQVKISQEGIFTFTDLLGK